jgi:hypothetical protein
LAINFLEIWHSSESLSQTPDGSFFPGALIPFWALNNIMEQMVIPKLEQTLEEECQTKSSMGRTDTWILPWLPFLRDHLSRLVYAIRNHFTVSLRNWHPSDVSAIALVAPWKESLSVSEYEGILSRVILPKLIGCLRTEFTVNPQQQDIRPLTWIFEWDSYMPDYLLDELIKTEFFPKWHHVLQIWLQSNQVNYDHIQQWYVSWKSTFPTRLLSLPGIKGGFMKGLQLIGGNVIVEDSLPIHLPQRTVKLSFKEILENTLGEHGLLLLPENRVKMVGVTRFVIYRVTRSPDSKRNLHVYIDDGVIFLENLNVWNPISMNELMIKADEL